jgi:hypothetical protein
VSSPWDGADRRWLFGGIASVAAWDLASVAIDLIANSGALPHPHAPRWLLVFAESPVLVLAVAFAGLAALAASTRWRIAGFLVALVCSAVLVEALAAATDGPWRARFFAGAALCGALLAECWAKWAGASAIDRERAAETGALAMLAATWFGAGMAKLGGAGLEWADSTTLRAIAIGHAHVDAPGLARVVADTPALGRVLAIGTVCIQLAAPALLLGARARLLVAVALVTFHLGVAAVTRIGYWQPVALLVVFALPWSHWLPARTRSEVDAEPQQPRAPKRASTRLSIALAALVMLAWWPAVRAYSALHHRPRAFAGDGAPIVSRRAVATFGPIAAGDALAEGWWIAEMQREPDRLMVVVARDDGARAVLWVSARDRAQAPSPFDGEHVAVAYGEASVPVAAFAPAARALAQRLDAAEHEW